jgi:hypothetical protein
LIKNFFNIKYWYYILFEKMHRKFTSVNEQHEPPIDNILEWKNTILTSLNELINLNLEDLSIKFKFDVSPDFSSHSQVKQNFTLFYCIRKFKIWQFLVILII